MSSSPTADPPTEPGQPLPGFKVAYPMVSADRQHTGFNGVELGRTQVYNAVADAVCIFGARHRPPSRRCDCGFYCVHTLADARDLAVEPRYQHCVVLEVLASGRWVRYERGLRYSRQTVRTVRVPPCGCGRTTTRFVAVDDRPVGPWRRLRGACPTCVDNGTGRIVVDHAEFGRRAGGVVVVPEPGVEPVLPHPRTASLRGTAPMTPPALASPTVPAVPVVPTADEAGEVALLRAELTLLQARLDHVQERLERLTQGGERTDRTE